MSEKQQRLVYSIIDFLNQSIADGTVKPDDQEGLEVAIQCIGEAFGVDPVDEQQSKKLSVKPATLQSIFDVYVKTSTKAAARPKSPTPEEKAQADNYKQTGNNFMTAKKYDDAISAYNQAIAIDPRNPIYYSNRAAAYSGKGQHLTAAEDAEMAISVDPKFLKSYHRLGHAYFCVGEFEKSASAYQRGLDISPDTDYLRTALRDVKEHLLNSEDNLDPTDLARSSSGRGSDRGVGNRVDGGGDAGGGRGSHGAGGGAAAAGMPDLASMLSDPSLNAMAQSMAQNGGLERLMQNPAIANMMNQLQAGGEMPNLSELMNDPSIRDIASRFGLQGRR
ncbi:hypothetical protein H0H87_006260 [Tephrocybe sp. NHM501043]|nr:hypothetical protein H0H87_006260 [Tephrocybe sp. NHM501043]